MVNLAREKLGFTISGCHFFVYSTIKRPLECNYRVNTCPCLQRLVLIDAENVVPEEIMSQSESQRKVF